MRITILKKVKAGGFSKTAEGLQNSLVFHKKIIGRK
jgi:hypothetical protein